MNLELNSMKTRCPRKYVDISGELSSGKGLTVETKESFADNPLVVGERYQSQDFSLANANYPGYFGSGIVVFFIGKYNHHFNDFKRGQHLKVYEMKGQFGFATNNFTSDGKIIEKTWFKHIREGHITRVVSKMQSTFQTQMFNTMGIDIRTQEAYDMAAKGLIRPPKGKTAPVIYALRLTDFSPPYFTLEIECINEFDEYLFGIINEIGLKLKASAMCTGLRLKRYGPFTVEHSLLMKHWTSEHIIQNIKICKPLVEPLLRPPSLSLSDPTEPSDHEIFLETLQRPGIEA